VERLNSAWLLDGFDEQQRRHPVRPELNCQAVSQQVVAAYRGVGAGINISDKIRRRRAQLVDGDLLSAVPSA
jgi:hypothetical protein